MKAISESNLVCLHPIQQSKEIVEMELEELQSSTTANDVVDFRVSPKEYHPDYIQAVGRLIDLRVALDKIPEVFDVVLGLVGKKVAQRPCRPSLMKMSGSRLPASQLQINEVFFQYNNKNNV